MAAPKRVPLPPAFTYTDAGTIFGRGVVLLLPQKHRTRFFWTPAQGRPIDYLKVEAAVVANAVFRPRLQRLAYHKEISFVANSVSLA